MRSRTKKIAVIAAIVLVIGLFGYFILLPRVLLYIEVKDLMPSMDKMPEYFMDFSLSNSGSVKTVENGYFSIKIPSNMELDETESSSQEFYIDRETNKTIFIDKEPYDASVIALDINTDMNELKEFERIGHGIPDTAYNTYKCMLSFNRDDYSFWNLEKGKCFVSAAVDKDMISRDEDVFFYERDDIRAVIWDLHGEFENVSVNLFNVNDLNMQFDLCFCVDSSEEAFAIINSVEFSDGGGMEIL